MKRIKNFNGKTATALSIFGSAGVLITTAVTIRATFKAKKILDAAEEKKGEKLTKTEAVSEVVTVYIPTAMLCTATIVCIFGANTLNKKQQASLASAYTLLSASYNEYKNKVIEKCGEDIHNDIIDEIAKEKITATIPSITNGTFCTNYGLESIVENQEKVLFYLEDDFGGRYFESTPLAVYAAEYNLNRNFVLGGVEALNEFYNFLGIPQTDEAQEVGWSYAYGYSFIDFTHRKIVLDDGLVCYCIGFVFSPDVDFMND